MSIQWTIVASFLYAEIATLLILLLPFISPKRWQKFFRSRILNSLQNQSNFYFNMFIIVLLLFFVDAIREVRKYTIELEDNKADSHAHIESEMQIHMKLFRSQRNFYISGFALFLWLVLRRMVTLISSQASLMANNEAAMKQAQNATDIANKLMQEQDKRQSFEGETADNAGNVAREANENEIKELKKQLDKTKDELTHAKVDLESMKKQSESVTKEYDRLLSEFDKVQHELQISQGAHPDKKEE